MYSYYFIIIVGILALVLNQSNAFTLSSSSTPTTNQSYKYITSSPSTVQSSFSTTTRLGMSLPTSTSSSSSSSSSVSRRGFLESVAVSCGSLVQQSLVVDMTADQVKDEGIHDMLELLVGDSDDDREFSSCLSDAISDTNHNIEIEEEVARYLPMAGQLVEQCISRRSGMHR